MEVTVRAPAKVNLHLGVGRPRNDGFHPLDTVFQAVGLYDDVRATDGEGNVSVPVLIHLLTLLPSLERGLVMVQAEVADRLSAGPGSKV